MTKELISLDVSDRFFEKDGKYFVLLAEKGSSGRTKDGHKLLFREVNKAEYNKRLAKFAAELVAKSGLTAEKILTECLRQLSLKELKKLEKNLREKKPVSVRKGCIELKCGSSNIMVMG